MADYGKPRSDKFVDCVTIASDITVLGVTHHFSALDCCVSFTTSLSRQINQLSNQFWWALPGPMPSKTFYSLYDLPQERRDLVKEAFMQNVDKTGSCWLWRGSGPLRSRFQLGGLRVRPSRLAYELFKGPVTSGMFIHHPVCKNSRCVNPNHLQPASRPTGALVVVQQVQQHEKGVLDAAFERIESELKKLKESMVS
jgi:hypothetical protein